MHDDHEGLNATLEWIVPRALLAVVHHGEERNARRLTEAEWQAITHDHVWRAFDELTIDLEKFDLDADRTEILKAVVHRVLELIERDADRR